jgi:pyrimidine-specific ribonucleoside hydrolase
MKRLLILIIALTINIVLIAHPWKPGHYVIIDTDGGIDDMKAITMMLASPDVRVLAITVSPGVLNTDAAYIKVKSLLNSFYHEGIPVGINRSSSFKSPDFQVALNTEWGKETGLSGNKVPDCISLIDQMLKVEKTKVSFICLGGMSTASQAIKEITAFRQQVKEIIWSAAGLTDTEGFNYNIDRSAAENARNGEIPVRVVRGTGEKTFYDGTILKAISEIPTIYAEKISSFFSSEITKAHPYSYSGNDEMVALFLHFPELFNTMKLAENTESSPGDIVLLKNNLLKILSGETVAKNQVIKNFPVDPSFYFDDIEPSVTAIIKRYGIEEWISGVITNELHRHLGVFAIVGVKMGIRAREYFNTGVDEFSAVSFAGSVPPLSCMNDGIQVSTGATPGHGLLTVNNESPAIPSVEFTYLNRKIRLTLKPDLTEKISSELKEINFIYGLDSNIYWELVRKNSIKYWLNLDRHNIFIIEEVL